MRLCICIPAKDEADRLPVLLNALAAQSHAGPLAIAICLNNTTDDSLDRVKDIAAIHRGRLEVSLEVCVFPSHLAHVGSARRRAMDMGAALLPDEDDLLLTTDADARPPDNWVSANLAAIEAGADMVGGRLELDDSEEISLSLSAARALCDLYWARVRDIEDRFDPLPWDPAPRHGDHTGGSLAIKRGLYQRAGGVPLLATGEDRALVLAALSQGGRLRHAPDVWTRVSARRHGRAAGGMAAAMAEMDQNGAPLLPGFEHWRERARWRRDYRLRFGDAALPQAESRLPPMPCDMWLADMECAA